MRWNKPLGVVIMNGFNISYMKRVILFLLVAMLLALYFAPAAPALSIGEKVPDFTLIDMGGSKVSLSDFKGQRVILNFWSTWCPPCRQEMPEFNEMNAGLKKSGEAVLLAVNLTDGRRETKGKVEQFMKKNSFDMLVLLDTQGNAASIFHIQGIPTTIIIDREGVMRGEIVGATTKDNVMKLVRNTK